MAGQTESRAIRGLFTTDMKARYSMREAKLTLPEVGLIAGTRVAAGAGTALLLARKLKPEQRRTLGWTLVAVGLASTIPLMARVMRSARRDGEAS